MDVGSFSNHCLFLNLIFLLSAVIQQNVGKQGVSSWLLNKKVIEQKAMDNRQEKELLVELHKVLTWKKS